MSVTAAPERSIVEGAALDPATALATVLADELSRCGVTDAVVSPGSRSAPLARALWAHPRIAVHVRVDERSAGFLAIGLARAGGRPAAVVCTSGTAAANLYPAVLEAHHDRVPLVVLTADRPPELRGTGANQTTDQIKLYGAAARLCIELGVPERRPGQVRYWRSVVSRAVAAARTGPVHVNVALREARLDGTPAPWPEPLHGRAGGGAWTAASPPAPPAVDLAVPPRGLVVAGAGADATRAVAFAEAAGWPVLAEPHSNARHGPHALTSYVDLLAHPAIRAELAPDAIVTYGRPGLSRELLGRYGDVPNTVVDPYPAWDDPGRDAALVVPALDRPLLTGPRDPAWLARWQALDRVACAALDGVLDAGGLSEPRVARDVAAWIPDGGLLFVAASMPIRDLERTMRRRTGLTVLANRGLAGIDGAVSTAIGAALAHRERGGARAYALLGDLSFLHDQNGLLLGSGPAPDLTLVVVNNDGGGIFSLLEPAGTDDGFEELFGTPHGVDLANVAAAAGWRYARVDEPGDLPDQLARPGARIVEVRSDRQANAVLHRRLRRDVAAALNDAL